MFKRLQKAYRSADKEQEFEVPDFEKRREEEKNELVKINKCRLCHLDLGMNPRKTEFHLNSKVTLIFLFRTYS